MSTRTLSHTSRRPRRRLVGLAVAFAAAALVLATVAPGVGAQAQRAASEKPTIVLVHGAWADASNWNQEVLRLERAGYHVFAIANPLRSLAGDAASVRSFLETIGGPIVLVGHSYGGAVITNAATGVANVKALVYIDAFAPDSGESAIQLAGPDSALTVLDPSTVFDLVPSGPVTPATDLYLKPSVVFTSFATGLSHRQKALVAATQRPATLGALSDASGPPAWQTIPSWYLVGTKDKIIPPGVELTMAQRAGSVVNELKAGHLGLISDPGAVTREIKRAAMAVRSAP